MKTQLFYILIISLCTPLTNIYGIRRLHWQTVNAMQQTVNAMQRPFQQLATNLFTPNRQPARFTPNEFTGQQSNIEQMPAQQIPAQQMPAQQMPQSVNEQALVRYSIDGGVNRNETNHANICSIGGGANITLTCPEAHTCYIRGRAVNATLNCPAAHNCSIRNGANPTLNCPSAQSCTISGGANARCNTR